MQTIHERNDDHVDNDDHGENDDDDWWLQWVLRQAQPNIRGWFLREGVKYYFTIKYFQRVILMSEDNNHDNDINIIKLFFQAVTFSTSDLDVWQHFLRLGSGW